MVQESSSIVQYSIKLPFVTFLPKENNKMCFLIMFSAVLPFSKLLPPFVSIVTHHIKHCTVFKGSHTRVNKTQRLSVDSASRIGDGQMILYTGFTEMRLWDFSAATLSQSWSGFCNVETPGCNKNHHLNHMHM